MVQTKKRRRRTNKRQEQRTMKKVNRGRQHHLKKLRTSKKDTGFKGGGFAERRARKSLKKKVDVESLHGLKTVIYDTQDKLQALTDVLQGVGIIQYEAKKFRADLNSLFFNEYTNQAYDSPKKKEKILNEQVYMEKKDM